MIAPTEAYNEPQWLGQILPLVGSLVQLESLVLREWRYRMADIDSLGHLTNLQALRVRPFDCQKDLQEKHRLPTSPLPLLHAIK